MDIGARDAEIVCRESWCANILHLLGLDHEQLTDHYAGREILLTDVAGSVATEILM